MLKKMHTTYGFFASVMGYVDQEIPMMYHCLAL